MRLKNLLKIKTQLKLASYLITSYIVLMITLTGLIGIYNFITDPVKQEMIAEVLVPSVHAEPSMKEWVKNEIESAGLDWDIASKLIECESKGDDYAYNFNTNGTSDFGLWQINSIHKATISPRDRFDYKIATKWAINKRLNDGGWQAWVCANKI